MDTGKPFAIPARFVVLDVIGTVLLATGLLKVVAGIDWLPPQLLFEGYGFAFIVGGAILMVPLIAHVVVHAISRSGQSVNP
ncbi:MAG: hypothetical protein AMJ66_06735 [Betaproteobacteria bacterium SG8_40]|jgi:hypothetical protein|nr:MAG: hypothetical protein AMJ66_06735 [Betaproteobacteria bacterium SG8_40]